MCKNLLNPCILIHYGEISLKKGNRSYFIKRLIENIKEYFKGITIELKEIDARILLTTSNIEFDNAKKRLSKIFGISSFSSAYYTKHIEIEKLSEIIVKKLSDDNIKFETFGIMTKRGYKQFPYTSFDINSKIGQYIKEEMNKKVNLSSPDIWITIEITKDKYIFYFKKEIGLGGLPIGITGKLISLISGGIDSPVASWRMMKRGARIIFVHFHSYPYHQKTSQEKVIEIVRKLTEYQIRSKLYLIPFAEIQLKIKTNIPSSYRIVLYRRMMMRIAEEIAKKENALGLVTGESLGQVSSQTLENINTINSVVKLPVFRPLISMDKQEIIKEAKNIGTFDISIIKDQDCCQLFLPQHPAIKTTIEEVENAELRIAEELKQMSLESIKKSEVILFDITKNEIKKISNNC